MTRLVLVWFVVTSSGVAAPGSSPHHKARDLNHNLATIGMAKFGGACWGQSSQGKEFHRHKALPMSTETKQRGIVEKSADTITIEHRLRKLNVDEIVTYDELSTLLGRDVRTHCSGNMQTARKELEKDALFFGTVRGQGIIRLSNDGAVESSKSHLVRARRATTRGLRKLACVPFEQLSDKAKKSHLVTSAQLGAMNLFAKSSSAKKIEQKTNGSEQPVPIGETLKLFGG